jgi:hypothetical protein
MRAFPFCHFQSEWVCLRQKARRLAAGSSEISGQPNEDGRRADWWAVDANFARFLRPLIYRTVNDFRRQMLVRRYASNHASGLASISGDF